MSQTVSFGYFVRRAIIAAVVSQAVTLAVLAFYFLFARLVTNDMAIPSWVGVLGLGLAVAAVLATFVQYRAGELPEPGSGWGRRRRAG